jgi:TolA-binding protein
MQIEESKQILMAITEVQTNIKHINSKMDELGKLSSMTYQNDQAVKSAHNRIDDIKEEMAKEIASVKAEAVKEIANVKSDYDNKIRNLKEAFNKLDGNLTWVWRTLGAGLVTFIFGVILLLIKIN